MVANLITKPIFEFGPEINKSIAYEPLHENSNNVVCATSKGSDQSAQSDQSLC